MWANRTIGLCGRIALKKRSGCIMGMWVKVFQCLPCAGWDRYGTLSRFSERCGFHWAACDRAVRLLSACRSKTFLLIHCLYMFFNDGSFNPKWKLRIVSFMHLRVRVLLRFRHLSIPTSFALWWPCHRRWWWRHALASGSFASATIGPPAATAMTWTNKRQHGCTAMTAWTSWKPKPTGQRDCPSVIHTHIQKYTYWGGVRFRMLFHHGTKP